MSEAKKGKVASEETRLKQSIARKGKPFTKKHIENMRKSFKKGTDHHQWKGDKVGYAALHDWVQRYRGKANKCEWCGSTSKMEWANISRKYKRDLNDFMQLCHSCHMKHDNIPKKVWATRRARYGVNGHKPRVLT